MPANAGKEQRRETGDIRGVFPIGLFALELPDGTRMGRPIADRAIDGHQMPLDRSSTREHEKDPTGSFLPLFP